MGDGPLELALAIALVLVLAVVAAALHGVLDGRLASAPASITVLAPLAESARLLRRRGGSAGRGGAWWFGGVLLLAAAAAQTGVLAGAPVWWLGATALLRWLGVRILRSGGPRSALVGLLGELLLALAVAGPVVAAGTAATAGIAAAQLSGWFAVTMPVAFVAFLVASVVPLSAPIGGLDRPGHVRLVVLSARSLLFASVIAAAARLYLGGGGWAVLGGEAALLLVVVVLVGRRFPQLDPTLLPLRVPAIALALAALQLVVVLVLARAG